MAQRDLWTPVNNAFGALAAQVGPALQQAVKDADLEGVNGWQHLLLASRIAPEPLTVDRVRVRSAYNAPRVVQAALDNLAQLGYLTSGYAATQKAGEAMDSVLARQRAKLVEIALLPDGEAEQLVALMGRVCDRAARLDEPDTPCLADQRLRPASADLPLTERFVRYAGQMNAFRDDCHLAAWKRHDIDGHVWEIFTHIWRGEATSHEDMPEQLMQFRGYTAEESAAALEELARRGWIEPADEAGKYRISAAGNALRQEAEDLTDQYFYAAFNVLSAAEQDALFELATRAYQNLQPVQQ